MEGLIVLSFFLFPAICLIFNRVYSVELSCVDLDLLDCAGIAREVQPEPRARLPPDRLPVSIRAAIGDADALIERARDHAREGPPR